MTIGVESGRVSEELSVLVNGLASAASCPRHRREPIVRRGVVGIERDRSLQLTCRLVESTCPRENHAAIQSQQQVAPSALDCQRRLWKGVARVPEEQPSTDD